MNTLSPPFGALSGTTRASSPLTLRAQRQQAVVGAGKGMSEQWASPYEIETLKLMGKLQQEIAKVEGETEDVLAHLLSLQVKRAAVLVALDVFRQRRKQIASAGGAP